jgi:uncharacterized membrane protein
MLSYVRRYSFLFLLGGGIYVLIELLYRGRSHFSMFLAGGLSVVLIRIICGRMKGIVLRCLVGGIIITSVELVFGIIFNLWLGMDVWDYSHLPFNILGQVCPYFTLAWAALSVPALWLGNLICGRHKRA